MSQCYQAPDRYRRSAPGRSEVGWPAGTGGRYGRPAGVPNLACADIAAARDFYVGLLGFEVVMDMGWIVTVASPSNPTAQISFAAEGIRADSDAPVLTVEVGDVDAAHAAAVARGLDVVRFLRDEPWGVRRFFVRDPDGRVVNVVCHPGLSGV